MAIEFDNSFTVPVPPEQAWDVLLDVERIAPCMPGASVDDVEGDVVNGRLKIKVGPVSLTYRGTAKFTDRNIEARTVSLEASGKETRGAGTASADVLAVLAPDPAGTLVNIHTAMNVTGRPAQFGRGVMVEVGGKLVEKFADNLAQLISPGGATEADDAATAGEGSTDGASADPPALAETGPGSTQPSTIIPAASTASAPAAQPNEDSINLVRLVGPSILKRAIPVVIGAAAMALLGWRIRHRFPRGGRGQKA
jgi:uncharacterized protein